MSVAEKERRNQVLLADQDEIGVANNAHWVGREVEVLAEGPSLRNAARWSGRCGQNKIVIFDPPSGIQRGDLVRIAITRANPQTLFGDVRLPE